MGIDFDSVEIILNSTGERNVIEKMVTDLVSQMEEEKLIDNSIREYYVYALVSWVESFLTVGTIIVISMAVRKFFPTLLFLIFFLMPRLQLCAGKGRISRHLNRYLDRVGSRRLFFSVWAFIFAAWMPAWLVL